MRRFILMGAVVIAFAPAHAEDNLLQMGKSVLDAVQSNRNAQPGAVQTSGRQSALGADQIGAGLREALKVGAQRAVTRLGRTDGFLKDPAVHIPLPGMLAQLAPALKMAGAGGLSDDLETRLNRAAEAAVPQAANIFGNAASKLTISDAQTILAGPPDAATSYFRDATHDQLATAMRPIVEQNLADVGAAQALGALTSKLQGMPFAQGMNLDLTSYAVDKALDGLFLYLAQEEGKIRQDPAKRSTDLLRSVFGS